MPKVSIIIPAYNAQNTITEALKSALDQTFKDFEILVILNGCTDNTKRIVEIHQDPRIRILEFGAPLGISRTRNIGIGRSSPDSKYIAFLDADDFWEPQKLELQVQTAEKFDAGLVYSWVEFVNQDSERLGHCTNASYDGCVIGPLLLTNFIGSGSNALVLKAAFSTCGYFDVDLPCTEDWGMWLRISRRYRFAHIPKVLSCYRTDNPESLSSVYAERGFRISINALIHMFDLVHNKYRELKPSAVRNLCQYLAHRNLNKTPGRNRGMVALACLAIAAKNCPGLLIQKWFWKPVLRSLSYIVVGPAALHFCARFDRYTNIDVLFNNMVTW